MARIDWLDKQIQVNPPKKPKKISGTYFASILGADPYKSPFEAWCKSTRTYEPEFLGNKYTHAGEVIEPKVFEFLRKSMGYQILTPSDVYGADYFKKTWGDFFPQNKVFGGMWDALIVDDERNVVAVVEVKTVQIDGKSGTLEERWKDGEAPDYQALQASLYAHNMGVSKVLMVCVTLEDKKGDYEHPELVVPSYANGNVYIDEFDIYERYPKFQSYVDSVTQWWNEYVLTGISPEYDEKKDAEILKVLRTNSLNPDTEISSLLEEAETLKSEIDNVLSSIAEKEKRLKIINEQIKEYAKNQFRDGDKKVEVKGTNTMWVLSRTVTNKFDDKAFKEVNPEEYAKYLSQTETYRLTTSNIKESK